MRTSEVLATAGIDRLDAEVLLSQVLGVDRTWLIAHGDDELREEDADSYRSLAARRKNGEPLAYIVGMWEFYGRAFIVRPGILVPRPCTEELVTTALALLSGKNVAAVRDIDEGIVAVAHIWGSLDDVRTIVDVGAGSGCIAITLACEDPKLRCIGTDVSAVAIDTARANAEKFGVADRVTFVEGNLLDSVADLREPFLLVTNPPYVANEELLGADVRAHEPRTALMGGGDDGGALLRELVLQGTKHPFCRGIVAECLAAQADIVTGS